MSKDLTVKSQQLTDRQQTLSNLIVKDGTDDAISFAKKVLKFDKIKSLSDEDFEFGLSMLLTRLINLLGIKQALSDLNKQDIIEMLDTAYKNISLQEINYAFKLERYNQLPPKTEHYQLFNAEYVSAVLKKYKEWLAQVRYDNNLPISVVVSEKPNATQEEIDKIMRDGSIRCFEEYKTTGIVREGNTHIYDHLIDDLKIHAFSVEEKNAAIKIARKKIKESAKKLGRIKYKEVLNSLEIENNSAVKNKAKRLLLESYFLSLGNKHLEDKI